MPIVIAATTLTVHFRLSQSEKSKVQSGAEQNENAEQSGTSGQNENTELADNFEYHCKYYPDTMKGILSIGQ